jgi:hypothetical protein
MTFVMNTTVGPADVLHRLALGVEALDSVTGNPVATPVRVGQEVPPRMRPQPVGFEGQWPCLDFETNGTARYKLRHGIGGPNRVKVNADGSPSSIVVRIHDPWRRFVPRRFRIPVWTRLELEAGDPAIGGPPPGAYVAMASRLVRPVLFPGSAYPVSRGTTVIRGRVVRDGRPVRWPRVIARVGGVASGVAHGDERGEFLLMLSNEWTLLAAPPSTIDVNLTVRAVPPANGPQVDPDDPLADLVVENVNRPLAVDGALSGTGTPPGYQDYAVPAPVEVTVGKLTKLPPIVFQP